MTAMGTTRRLPFTLSISLALLLATAPGALRAQVMGGIAIGSSRGNGNGGNGAMIPLDLPAADPPSTTDRLDGVVLSSVDLKPVARVLVTTGDRRFAALTDYQGRFSFDLRRPVPDPGSAASSPGTPGFSPQQMPNSVPVQFQLRKPGYTNRSATVYFSTSRPDGPQPPVQLTMQPSATIIGRVESDSDVSSANFYVSLYVRVVQNGRATWQQRSSARMDPDGRFRAANLAPGDYKLVAVPNSPFNSRSDNADVVNGLLPAYNSNSTSLESAPPIHVAAGETASANFVIRRAAFYRVTLPVAESVSQGLRVVLSPNVPERQLNFNARDHAIEGYLPSGDYEIHLVSNGNFAPVALNQAGVNLAMATVTPGGAQLCATVHLHVGSAAVHAATPITLHPVPEIPVEVTRDYTDTSSGTQLDPNRRNYNFNLEPVDRSDGGQVLGPNGGRNRNQPPDSVRATGGAYTFMFSTGGAYAASITSGGADLLQQPLIIDDNVTPQPIFVTLRNDVASITIHAPSSAIAPAPTYADTMMYAIAIPLDRPESQPSGPIGFAATQSLAEGLVARNPTNRATFSNLAPGHYLVLAAHDPQYLLSFEYRNPDVLRDLASQGVTVNLTGGQKADIEVPLMPEPSSASTQNMAGIQ
jgi:hypothetical protein